MPNPLRAGSSAEETPGMEVNGSARRRGWGFFRRGPYSGDRTAFHHLWSAVLCRGVVRKCRRRTACRGTDDSGRERLLPESAAAWNRFFQDNQARIAEDGAFIFNICQMQNQNPAALFQRSASKMIRDKDGFTMILITNRNSFNVKFLLLRQLRLVVILCVDLAY